MAHLKKGADGHLLKNAAGHLVKECGAPCTDCADDTPTATVTNIDNTNCPGLEGDYTFNLFIDGSHYCYWGMKRTSPPDSFCILVVLYCKDDSHWYAYAYEDWGTHNLQMGNGDSVLGCTTTAPCLQDVSAQVTCVGGALAGTFVLGTCPGEECDGSVTVTLT